MLKKKAGTGVVAKKAGQIITAESPAGAGPSVSVFSKIRPVGLCCCFSWLFLWFFLGFFCWRFSDFLGATHDLFVFEV